MRRIVIFDTTLRDGEQAPGASLTPPEKLEIAKQLARLGVDVIEGGFPIASPGDAQAVRMIARAVKGPTIAALARSLPADIEFSPEDASRTEPAFLHQVIEAVIKAGATTVNIPDTVGFAIPEEFGRLIHGMMERVPNIHRAVISVHCHNDLGLAVPNSLSAIANGAGQVE